MIVFYNYLSGSQIISVIKKETFHSSLVIFTSLLSALLKTHRLCLIFEVLDFCLKNLPTFVLYKYLISVRKIDRIMVQNQWERDIIDPLEIKIK